MNSITKGLEPQSVFKYFEAIASIPHGSFNTDAIADYCEGVAAQFHLPCIRDAVNNLIVTIPASAGYEEKGPVILQGHLDMVCEKVAESSHNFLTDPLSLYVKGDRLSAKGTTLGGDDGIAIAMGLALMEDTTIAHPKVYCVFTSDEEVGMPGAAALDLTPIADAQSMINVDSEAEGILTAGCAGGAVVLCAYPLRYTKAKGLKATLRVSGLLGGHSGEMISRFGENANILLGQVLFQLAKDIDYSIITLEGGKMDNVIPKEAYAEILIGPNERVKTTTKINALSESFRGIAGRVDKDLSITIDFGEERQFNVFGRDSEEKALFLLLNTPNGVQAMNRSVDGLVDTSLNLGCVKVEDGSLTMSYCIRGSMTTSRDFLCDKLCAFAVHLGGTTSVSGVYPPWEYREQSPLRDLMIATYEDLFGKTPEVVTIHAGLECGMLSEKLPHLDIVSIGPDLFDIHTPSEELSISSTKRTWDYLLAILEKM